MALPLDLASALRVFIKVLARVLALLLLWGISIVGYLDDLVLRAQSALDLERDLSITIKTLFHHIDFNQANVV